MRLVFTLVENHTAGWILQVVQICSNHKSKAIRQIEVSVIEDIHLTPNRPILVKLLKVWLSGYEISWAVFLMEILDRVIFSDVEKDELLEEESSQ